VNAERIFGAFLFAEDWQPWSPSEASSQFDVLAARGVNAVFTEAETYRDDLIEAAHHAGLSFIGGIACFSDHAHQNQVLEQRPELWPIDASGARRTPMEWYVGVTPTFEDYAAGRLALAEQLVAQHALDGFVLDFIRWPIHWSWSSGQAPSASPNLPLMRTPSTASRRRPGCGSHRASPTPPRSLGGSALTPPRNG